MARTASERVTLAQIAEEAGVSLATISKVLNGRHDVSAATRTRVEALLAGHGYLRRRSGPARSGLIELVFHALDAAWSMEIIRGVEDIATQNGMSVVLTESGSRHAPGPEWMEGVLRRRPVGVVLVFSDLPTEYRAMLRSRGIPFVIIDPAGDPSPDVPSVGSANWSGGLMATRHLIDLGHRRIAAITGPEDMMCSHARIDGFRSAMTAAGLPIESDWVRYGDFTTTGGQRHGRDLLERDDRPTAIFAGSDLQALGVLEAVRGLGLRVPEDLSLVGYDDIPLTQWVSPRLTTVRQPLRRMAEEATRLVLRMSQGPLESVPRMDLATSLVVRESTAAPAA
ncbi:LacI family xylobiose transport system transcriptional regulator [Diaminobutyricimonas aerilata]|uniref:LacI family xylobiose transport system transcriptional regulator n=1 Tax=Diaminobutyricimonas aerilata TaxID=1162967 RepID=A0A2M9CGS0_9MICO|nr:LacI family DNA-binding transcriptional regulator [Diaminobutyricimonas aerilata]PJJ71079.1 LacI family xylobiose transport system transcriptional regulator [Diaminobutyricimonas aerilata]